jgi:hypothetical protein
MAKHRKNSLYSSRINDLCMAEAIIGADEFTDTDGNEAVYQANQYTQ